jgi:hypothetical protein
VRNRGRARTLACVAVLGAAVTAAGCGSSSSGSPPSQAETYVTQRITAEMNDVGPTLKRVAGHSPEVFAYCDGVAGGAARCEGSVNSRATHQTVASQGWEVDTNALGQVTSARALQEQLVPVGPAAEALALERQAKIRARLIRAGRHPRIPKASVQLKGPQTAVLKPPYVCVDNGHGKVLWQGVLTESKHFGFRAPRLRLIIGNSNAVVHVNGRIYRIPASPYGLTITPRRISYLPAARRHCGG